MKENRKIAVISIFGAVVAVLQIVATFINFGSFPITLTLVPIIVAGAMFGVGVGAIMGTVFGAIVALMVITGADPSGAAMLAMHPFITVSVCVLKGTMCGAAGAFVYRLLKDKNQKLAIILAAAITPIVNTGTLALAIILFFGGAFATLIALFVTVNFLIELVIDVLLAPGLLGLINRYSKRMMTD